MLVGSGMLLLQASPLSSRRALPGHFRVAAGGVGELLRGANPEELNEPHNFGHIDYLLESRQGIYGTEDPSKLM